MPGLRKGSRATNHQEERTMREILYWTVLVGTVVVILSESWTCRKNPRVSSLLISYLTLHLLTISALKDALAAAMW